MWGPVVAETAAPIAPEMRLLTSQPAWKASILMQHFQAAYNINNQPYTFWADPHG